MHASAIAALDKNLAALKRIKEIEVTLLRLKEIAPAYRHAAADRTLGLLYRNSPKKLPSGRGYPAVSSTKPAARAEIKKEG
jgi:hypothetical protein